MSEGLFTIRHFEPFTGKAHIARVCCDLCKGEHEIDTTRVDSIEQAMDRVVDMHVCTKPKKIATEPAVRKFKIRTFGEVVAGITNRMKFRRRPDNEEE